MCVCRKIQNKSMQMCIVMNLETLALSILSCVALHMITKT
jgi:hypothetical protein